MEPISPDSGSGPAAARDALRRRMRAMLAAIPPDDLERSSRRAAANLIDAGWLDGCRVLMVFTPLVRSDGSREIETRAVAEEAWRCGLTVCAPRVDWHARRLIPVAIGNFGPDLVEGRHGVLEPRPGLAEVEPGYLDLVLVPGLAFDRSGHRLGHGVGFYDRFLVRPEVRARRIGMALAAQIVESVPREAHDVPMHAVATEDRILLPSPHQRR